MHKSLYGLKQAPRAWHAKLKEELEAMGFCSAAADPALFINTNGDPIYLLTYVDDILAVTNDSSALADTKSKILAAFDARDMGEATCFLGMDIQRDRNARTITFFFDSAYITRMSNVKSLAICFQAQGQV